MTNLDLLSSTNRVEVPFVTATIGDFTFGIFTNQHMPKSMQIVDNSQIPYPSYIGGLVVDKINGQVNKYKLTIKYPVRAGDDPNFFEKIFSSVSSTRKLVLSYGDLSSPSFIYKREESIIKDVVTDIDIANSILVYTVESVSNGFLTTSGAYTFRERVDKPSNVIKELLYSSNDYYGLLSIFPGMRDRGIVERLGLIPSDDKEVKLELKTNVTVLEYLSYLVNCMRPYVTSRDSSLYTIVINDYATQTYQDESNSIGTLEGSYFRINKCSKNYDELDVYTVDIGYPSASPAIQFSIRESNNYSILYDFQGEISNGNYVTRIGDNGEYEKIYAPVISSSNDEYKTREEDESWWTRVTKFPIKGILRIKGLLRPAILMKYVRVNVYFYGKKFNASGLYIITAQQDTIDANGYRTLLSVTRVDGDKSL